MEGKLKNLKNVIEYYSRYNSSLGLLPAAFRYFGMNKGISRWKATDLVAKRLEKSPVEVLILDHITAAIPKEKRKTFIEKPESLLGNQYRSFLKFANNASKNINIILNSKEDIFTPELNYELEHHLDNFKTYSAIIEDLAKVTIRNTLPYPYVVENGKYYSNSLKNKQYDSAAKNVVKKVFEVFREIVEHNSLRRGDKKYEENIALLLGFMAIEILFIPDEGNQCFKPILKNPAKYNYWNRRISYYPKDASISEEDILRWEAMTERFKAG